MGLLDQLDNLLFATGSCVAKVSECSDTILCDAGEKECECLCTKSCTFQEFLACDKEYIDSKVVK